MRMKKIYIVTGANGHLGGTLVRMLSKRGEAVRGLVLPGEAPQPFPHVRYYTGDVRDADSMRPLFADAEDAELLVLHTAGLVDIADAVSDRLYDVNVNGTKNMLALCREYGVRRLVYVSSVHAIPEEKSPAVLKEVASFSPERVTGGYAKTKAEATQAVLDAVQAGLDAVVVHPSGIIGPFDTAGNHLVQLVRDYLRGALPACVRGGYDFVDVRDVAAGCLLALSTASAARATSSRTATTRSRRCWTSCAAKPAAGGSRSCRWALPAPRRRFCSGLPGCAAGARSTRRIRCTR